MRGGCSLGLNYRYPVYRVSGDKFNNNNNNNSKSVIDINSINHLFAYKQTSKINDIQTHQHEASQRLQQSEHQEGPQKHPVNILVVDDEPDTLITYESFLSDEDIM